MAITVTSFKVNGVTATVSNSAASVELPYASLGQAVSITNVVATGSAEASPVYTGSVPSGTKVAAGTVTVTVADNASTPVIATVSLTITIDEESIMTVENINMAGWFKVKVVKLKDFDYESGGFIPPYKSKAVLAVNGPGGLTGYVYTDTSGSAPVQKVKLFAGTSEASGEITADVYLLLE